MRRRKVFRTQQGIVFWNNEVRALKTGAAGAVNMAGQSLADEKRRDIRTFYQADIERYLEIKTQSATHSETKKHRCLPAENSAFMKVRPTRAALL
ncbi:MAG: hypothetical protein ACLR17_00410 [Enterobacteriaceae bacterium]